MTIPKSYEALAADLASEKIISKTLLGQKEAYMMLADKVRLDLATWKQKACEAAEREAALREELSSELKELAMWKSNHASMVERAKLLRDRPDMPVERIAAFERMSYLQQRLTVAEQRAEEIEGLLFGDILEAMDDFGDRHGIKRCREIAKDIRALKPAEGEVS